MSGGAVFVGTDPAAHRVTSRYSPFSARRTFTGFISLAQLMPSSLGIGDLGGSYFPLIFPEMLWFVPEPLPGRTPYHNSPQNISLSGTEK